MPYDAMDAHLKAWDDIFASRPWGKYPPEELVRFMARRFARVTDKSALRVLEIGCGPGANLWYLAREGYQIAAIEGSDAALAQARERLEGEGLGTALAAADLRQGNFAVLPWEDASFDAVIDIEAVSANETAVIEAALAEAHRVLKPGGAFFGKMFGTESSGYGTGEEIELGTFREPTAGVCSGQDIAHFFSEPELRQLFGAFSDLRLDWVSRTDPSQGVVFEWLVQAEK